MSLLLLSFSKRKEILLKLELYPPCCYLSAVTCFLQVTCFLSFPLTFPETYPILSIFYDPFVQRYRAHKALNPIFR